MNRLANERSAYLKHAAGQEVHWYPWSEEAFEKAAREDKPVFLSTGAVWCHWCHVMAKECFYDPEIAGLLNRDFISIKLDRDERPDIDRRYQMAVSAMGSGGGWPLSVFLTHDKRPFFGGTYFPPEDRAGRPGLKKILRAVAILYREKREEIAKYTESVAEALSSAPLEAASIQEAAVEGSVRMILDLFDPEHGGFGESPKFPMPGAMEFLINRYMLTRNEHIGLAVRKTLDNMARGGYYDQLGGGFHRYSVDRTWTIPHFEKMADDNAWLLRNYIAAYAVFGDDLYRAVVEGTIEFIKEVLSDPEGGFYASQDADVTPDDEGGYFTWTEEDMKSILDKDSFEVVFRYFIREDGAMHHDEGKKVLCVARSAQEIADELGRPLSDVLETVRRAKETMLGERRRRQAPFTDREMYTSLNGMLISAFLFGSRILRDDSLRELALKGLRRIEGIRYVQNELYHTEGVKAFLDDYVNLADAFLSAYEVTGDAVYLQKAEEIMELCIRKLWDGSEGGFSDSEEHLLGINIKGVEDIPHPSGNSVAIRILLRLHLITNKGTYLKYAEKMLEIFIEKARGMGIHAGYYFSALDAYFNYLSLTICDPASGRLAQTALSSYNPYMTISYGEDRGYVIPCTRGVCREPVTDPEGLGEYLKR